jgi:hypothetical protein
MLIFPSYLVTAQVGEVITGVIVKDLIKEAGDVLTEATSAAEAAGINVSTNVIEGLNVSIANINNVASGQLNKTVGSLSKERQAIAFALAKSIEDVKSQTQYLVGFADMGLLSFEEIINDSVLGAFSGDSIVIQKILGRGQLEREQSQYGVGLIATNIGSGESNISNDFNLSINGNDIEFISDGTDRHKRIFWLNNSSLKEHFSDNSMSTVNLKIKVTQTHKGWMSWFDDEISHDVDINLVLYPKRAGELLVKYEVPTFKWDNVEGVSKTDRGGCPNCGPKGKEFLLKLEVIGGDTGAATPLNSERLINTSCSCTPSNLCGYDEIGSAGPHVINVSSSKNIITCRGHHRTNPTTWVLHSIKQRYVHDNPLVEQQKLKVNFKEVIKFKVPKDAIDLRLVGKLITGENINLGLAPLSDKTGQIILSGDDTNGLHKIFNVTIMPKSNVNLGIF